MRKKTAVGAGLLAAGFCCSTLTAQPAPVEMLEADLSLETGFLTSPAGKRGAVLDTVIRVEGAAWIKLSFDEVILGEAGKGAAPTVLRMTGVLDGAVQHHTTATLRQWGGTSAVFNGDAVRLELLADPGAGRSRIAMTTVIYGPVVDGGIATICGPTDDRTPSSDPRVARTFGGGCTAWMISDENNCFLTAGHCVSPGLSEVHFNVPLSNSNGSVNFPPPEDQYAVDQDSVQYVNGGIGNDWCYFGTFPNTETGLRAFEAQGAAFDLAATPPPLAGQTIRITGHGVDDSPQEWNQIQQTHAGPYVDFTGSALQYAVDTQGGNSGSPVINDDTGEAIGIHTHGGCSAGGGANSGTGSNNGGLGTALLQPAGVCLPLLPIEFIFPEGLPSALDPAGDSIPVEVAGVNGGAPQPGTGELHYDAGGGFVTVPMQEVEPNVYDAVFPAIPCGSIVSYYFSAESAAGDLVTNPLFAPGEFYTAFATPGVVEIFRDDFETDLGWTVSEAGGLADGQWERGVPIPHSVCDRGNPDADADGSGQCYLTDNSSANGCNSDVDGGSTILTSPVMDATRGTPFVSYWRWFDNTAGSNPAEDPFVVEVSADGGASWVELETVGPTGDGAQGGWFQVGFAVADFVTPTDQFRIRFIASDENLGSVVEAAVDLVALRDIGCDDKTPCPWDCADGGDGGVGILDFLALLAEWGMTGTACDLGGPGVGILDFLDLLANWGPCP